MKQQIMKNQIEVKMPYSRYKELEQIEKDYNQKLAEEVVKHTRGLRQEIDSLSFLLKSKVIAEYSPYYSGRNYKMKTYYYDKQALDNLPYLKRMVAKWILK